MIELLGIIHFEVFLISAILLNLTPGADTMYIIGRSVSQGKKAGIYSALGITSGAVVHTILASFGLSVILMKSVLVFNMIKIIGAVYLVYLGFNLLFQKNKNKEDQQRTLKNISNHKIFLQGLITNVTNPKVALFFLAFIPQFISTGNTSPLPFVLLGLTFCFTGGVWCIIVASFSSLLSNKLRQNSKVKFGLDKITGMIFIAMGIKLFQTKAAQ